MVGFKKEKLSDLDDISDGIDVNLGLDELDDFDDIPKEEIPREPKKPQRVQRPQKEETKINPAYIAIGGVAVVVLLIFGYFLAVGFNKEEPAPIETTPVVQESGEVIQPGMPGLTGTPSGENGTPIVKSEDYFYSLNGQVISPNYEVTETETLTDFINYTKYRSVAGQGLEFYWLEATYKGIPYKVQVPYSVFSKLEDSGITVVDMEVLKLADGNEMITYMNVRKDAKNILAR